jgi:hypothetical protein
MATAMAITVAMLPVDIASATPDEPPVTTPPISVPVPTPNFDPNRELAENPLPTVSAPLVELDRYTMRPNDLVTITTAGFTQGGIFATVCGNDALRGSSDCNVAASEGIETRRDGTPDTQVMVVAAPPTSCPCVIRVASSDNTEVAFADITLIGHPVVEPVFGPNRSVEPLAVSISAEPVSEGTLGWVRSSLGGPTEYSVTVTIRNRSNVDAQRVVINGAAGAAIDDIDVVLDLASPGVIARDSEWQETVRAVLPAPVFGTSVWRVDVLSGGPTVRSTDTTSHLPGLLILGIAILLLDLVLLLARLVIRRRMRARAGLDEGESRRPAAVTADAPAEQLEPIML